MVSTAAQQIPNSSEDELEKLKRELYSFVEEKLAPIPKIEQDISKLTVGVEQEFFLVDSQSKPISPEISQEFMKRISTQSGWTASESFKFEEVSNVVWRLSKQDEFGGLTTLKYKYHPHHFELSVPMCKDLHELRKKLEEGLALIEREISAMGLKILNSSILNIPSFHKSVMSEIPYYADLRKYRTKLYLRSGEAVDSEAINFPAVMASTKTVVGGINWFLEPQIVQRLFLIEPKIQSLLLPRKNIANGDIQEILRKRWRNFSAPLKFCPLVGFPRLKEWNVEEWIAAIMRTPLAGPMDKPWSAKTINELKMSPYGTPGSLFSSLSDFQTISPKLNGTITFNMDPMQFNLAYLMNLAALRLGLTCIIALGMAPRGSLAQAEAEWKKRMTGDLPLKATEAPAYFAAADKGLKLRKQAEEKYLVLM